MADVKVPEISPGILERLNKKTFGPADIKWIKTVNDSSVGNPCSSSAYLHPDTRVIIDESGAYFCLQANKKSEGTLNKAAPGDLILLYQRLENQKLENKCFTHLVTPVGSGVVPCIVNPKGWKGRWVKVIVMTGNRVEESVRAMTDDWEKMPFRLRTFLRHLSYPNSAIWEIANSENLSGDPLSAAELSALQNYIWEKFARWGVS